MHAQLLNQDRLDLIWRFLERAALGYVLGWHDAHPEMEIHVRSRSDKIIDKKVVVCSVKRWRCVGTRSENLEALRLCNQTRWTSWDQPPGSKLPPGSSVKRASESELAPHYL